jgi:hypothetical protein
MNDDPGVSPQKKMVILCASITLETAQIPFTEPLNTLVQNM